MSLWNMGGMNPKYKDFLEKYPDKTVIGIGWAFYWRFLLLVLAIEFGLIASFFALVFIFGGSNR